MSTVETGSGYSQAEPNVVILVVRSHRLLFSRRYTCCTRGCPVGRSPCVVPSDEAKDLNDAVALRRELGSPLRCCWQRELASVRVACRCNCCWRSLVPLAAERLQAPGFFQVCTSSSAFRLRMGSLLRIVLQELPGANPVDTEQHL